jgi:hypothetical protein
MLSVVTAGGPKSGNRSTVPLNDMLDVIKNNPRLRARTNPERLDYKVCFFGCLCLCESY